MSESVSESVSEPVSEPGTRSVGIDVLRGIAVALVMARHALPDLLPGAGVVGVVMFFALSGHLITTSLHREHTRTGRVRLGDFYRRRAVRLVPALGFMMAGFTAVVLLLDPLGDRQTLPGTWLVAVTWTANLPWGVEVSDAAFHLWTLAGEEQFYLVWPLLLLWALPRGRVPALVVTLLAVALGGIALSAVWLGSEADLAYALPTSWAACFVVGGASRLLVRPEQVARWAAGPLTLACLCVLGALALLPVRGTWWTYTLVAPVVAVATLVLLQLATAGRFGGDPRAPAVAAMVWLGQRSYAAYLWNYPLALWLRPDPDAGTPLWGALVAVLATLVLAEVSWRCVEQPASRRWGRVIPVPRVSG